MNTPLSITAIPKDLGDAADQLAEFFRAENQLQSFKDMPLDDCAGAYHHSIGAFMRNEWGLWGSETRISKHLESFGIYHADDKSATIFRALWHRENGRLYRIREDVEMYRAHWAQFGLGPDGAPRPKGGRR